MPLKVTWVGNEAGAAIPLAVLDPTAVTVMVLDETGAPSPAAHELVAKLRHGGQTDLVDFADVVVAAGNAKQGTLHLPPRWFWHLPRLELTASRLDGTGEPVRREVLVVTGPMLWPARIAMFLGGVGLLYTLAIFPQLKALPTLISPGPWAGAFAIFLVAARALRVRVLGHLANPLVGSAAALLAFGLSLAVALNATLVVNRSIEKYTASVLELDATDYTVLWGEPPLDKGFCRGPDDGASSASCVQFDSPATFWFPFAKRFVLRVFSVGCAPLPLFAGHKAFWKAQKQCVPGDPPPPLLERMAPGEAFNPSAVAAVLGPTDTVTVGFRAGASAFELQKPGDYELLDFSLHPDAGAADGAAADGAAASPRQGDLDFASSADAGAADGAAASPSQGDLELRMTGTGVVREITASLPAERVLTPALSPASHVLPATLLSSALVVGDLMVGLTGPTTHCELATTDQRLAALVLRSSQHAYRFTAAAPDFVRRFPVCWGESTPPSYGEIRLDPAWSPSVGWSVVLGDGAVAESIAVLDGAGKSLGQLQCRGARTGGPWTIGPLRVDSPSGAFGVVWLGDDKAPTWVAAPGHEDNPWPWGCWRDAPPLRLHGARGLFGARSGKLGVYRVSPTLRECRYYLNGDPVPPEDRCSPAVDADVASRWYRGAYAPAGDCDPRLWKLCPGPLKGKGAP